MAKGDPDDDSRVVKAPAVPPPRNPFEIRFLDYHGRPMAGMKCTLDWGKEKALPGTTDGDGVVKFSVPTYGSTHTLSGTIHIELFAGRPPINFEVVMLLQMPPGDQAEGAKVRLNNLGYGFGAKWSGASFGDQAVRALDRFRFANKIMDPKTLLPTGPAAAPFDAPTKNRIEQAHDTRGPLIAP
jgi:hypothetical protein